MNDAEIWVDFDPSDWPTERIMYGEMEHPYVKYVREDLHTALQARLAEAGANLKTVLDREAETHRRHDARLAKVEGERDAVSAARDMMGNLWSDAKERAEAAETRVKVMMEAAMLFEAACSSAENAGEAWIGRHFIDGAKLRAAWDATRAALSAMEKEKADE
jgi:hypothetical protein